MELKSAVHSTFMQGWYFNISHIRAEEVLHLPPYTPERVGHSFCARRIRPMSNSPLSLASNAHVYMYAVRSVGLTFQSRNAPLTQADPRLDPDASHVTAFRYEFEGMRVRAANAFLNPCFLSLVCDACHRQMALRWHIVLFFDIDSLTGSAIPMPLMINSKQSDWTRFK